MNDIRMSDKELLEAIADSRNETAFTILYNRYAKLIFKYLHSSVAEEDLISDISQNLWLYIWSNAGKLVAYPSTGSIKWLLLNMATRRVADFYRISSGRRIISLENLSEHFLNEHAIDSLEAKVYAKEIEHITQKVLERYPDIDKKCFLYQKQLNYTAAKTAHLLSISEANVYKKVSLISQDLRLRLEAAGYYSPIVIMLIGDLTI
ncbi:MAG: sigma-70 family RNA polymerase sigma factor [Prevotellaceae bacterium]|jgi:RNA polymerase sigma-70 factor (ECF subfamily)|nr:sigma-70 family RNA polymerase sigma factor [Prevotellaceae bacterium]